MDQHILVVDDEQDFLDSVRRGLITSGFTNVHLENDARRAAAYIVRGGPADVALIDITMPGMSGIELLDVTKRTSPNTECIMVTATNEARVAIDCMKRGAYDYLTKPVSRDELLVAIHRAIERKRLLDILALDKRPILPAILRSEAFRDIVTTSHKVLRLLREAELHARSDLPVLITGESGTGKELLARAIHLASRRAGFPFLPVNMASLTPTLFNSEFFGHVRGAFTGADKDRDGYLEAANRGSLFLDEIATLAQDLQGALLRVLQEGEFVKLGTTRPRKADIRFIIATNADLESMLQKGTFRKDLFYRLKGAWLHLPPLRERREDIPLLVNHFLERMCGGHGNETIEEEAVGALMEYDYPGNIRELESILQSAVNLAQGRPVSTRFLPGQLRKNKPSSAAKARTVAGPILPLAEMEKTHILMVYEHTGRNKAHTADILGIGLNTLRRKLRAYGAS